MYTIPVHVIPECSFFFEKSCFSCLVLCCVVLLFSLSFECLSNHVCTQHLHMCMQRAAEKKKNWRRKHEDFINSIRSAREYTEAETTGISHTLALYLMWKQYG